MPLERGGDYMRACRDEGRRTIAASTRLSPRLSRGYSAGPQGGTDSSPETIREFKAP